MTFLIKSCVYDVIYSNIFFLCIFLKRVLPLVFKCWVFFPLLSFIFVPICTSLSRYLSLERYCLPLLGSQLCSSHSLSLLCGQHLPTPPGLGLLGHVCVQLLSKVSSIFPGHLALRLEAVAVRLPLRVHASQWFPGVLLPRWASTSTPAGCPLTSGATGRCRSRASC